MEDNTKIDRLTLAAQREVGDKIFFLLWCATFLQAGLILWETATLIPGLTGLLGQVVALSIHATEYTSTAYLILNLAYVGRKEFVRWTKGIAGTFNPSTGAYSSLPEDEMVRRIRRGDAAILFWGLFYLVILLLHAMGLIPRLPQELTRTFIQVVGLYTFFAASKAKRELLSKQPKVSITPLLPSPVATTPVSTRSKFSTREPTAMDPDMEARILEAITKRGSARSVELMQELGVPRSTLGVYLKQMVESGALIKTGSRKSASYRVK